MTLELENKTWTALESPYLGFDLRDFIGKPSYEISARVYNLVTGLVYKGDDAYTYASTHTFARLYSDGDGGFTILWGSDDGA